MPARCQKRESLTPHTVSDHSLPTNSQQDIVTEAKTYKEDHDFYPRGQNEYDEGCSADY